jgi:hypothetical protein
MHKRIIHFIHELNIDTKKAIDTGLAMVLLLLIVHWWTGNDVFSRIGIATLVLSMTVPRIFKPLAYVWFGLAQLLGSIVSKFLLFIVFLLVVSPVGLFRRVLGKDPLKLQQWKSGTSTVFQTRNHKYSAVDIEKPY